MSSIRVDGLRKSFDDVPALRSAAFRAPAGIVTGLIGPNGSGKTTLLECVAGLLDPDAGSVTLADVDGETAAVRNRLFFMPESVRPWPEQRVAWALRYFAALHSADDARLSQLVQALSLTGILQSRLSILSKGEHRRVLLAMALLTSHDVLILDEPFDGLDLRQTREVMGILRNEASAGRTLLLSIHQLHDAGAVCDHLVLLSNGVVVGEGSMDELRIRVENESATLDEVFLALT